MTVINGEVVLFAPGATQAAEFLEHRPEPVSKRNRSKLLSGSRFGRWTIVELSGKLGNQSAYLCRCDCGIERRVRGTALLLLSEYVLWLFIRHCIFAQSSRRIYGKNTNSYLCVLEAHDSEQQTPIPPNGGTTEPKE